MQTYIVLDTETTGISAKRDRMVEIAAVKYVDDKPTHIFQTLLYPGMSIPPNVVAIHHITDSMVKDAPMWPDVRDVFLDFIGDHPLIAHNAPFDRGFLPELQNHTWLCSLRFARRLWPEAPKHGNQFLREWLNLDIKTEHVHRAVDDIKVTAGIFQAALSSLTAKGLPRTLDAVQQFIAAPLDVTVMPYGKHKGIALDQLPQSYLDWAVNNLHKDPALLAALNAENARRQEDLNETACSTIHTS